MSTNLLKSRSGLRLAAMITLLTGLAACDGSSSDNGGMARAIESLGSVFQQAFNQGPNDEPIDITNAGLQVDLTAEPFEL